MDDPLNGDALAQHARALSTLEWIGGLITRSTEDPRFPDRRFADLIAAMIQDLQDRRAMWHSKMPTEQREQIVREIFNLR